MKGIVFTEFLDMVETKFSPQIADEIISAAKLPSGGAYTAVGTYDHREIVALVKALSQSTGLPVPDLVRAFGRHLFSRFSELFPRFFQGAASAFDFLAGIEGYIHVEVRKLYPDAQLPRFEVSREGTDRMVMVYHSERGFHDLAEGLIEGCAAHFREAITVQKEDLSGGQGTRIRFTLTRQPAA